MKWRHLFFSQNCVIKTCRNRLYGQTFFFTTLFVQCPQTTTTISAFGIFSWRFFSSSSHLFWDFFFNYFLIFNLLWFSLFNRFTCLFLRSNRFNLPSKWNYFLICLCFLISFRNDFSVKDRMYECFDRMVIKVMSIILSACLAHANILGLDDFRSSDSSRLHL